jgi:hypothetical protein
MTDMLLVAKAAQNGVWRALIPSLGGATVRCSGTTPSQATAVPMAEWAGPLGEGGKAASRRSDVKSWHAAYYIKIAYLFRDVNNLA